MTTEETQEEVTEEVSPSALLPVRMTAWEWHILLQQLEEVEAIVNRDNTNLRILYRKVASQLAGHDAGIAERDKPEPEVRTTAPENPLGHKKLFRGLFGVKAGN